jgi:hypothetical protein
MEEINYFAKTNFRNVNKEFGIKTDDRRKHMYIIGKTGMGKTTLLANLAIQDIQAGRGMAFIDPHGEQAEALLEHIPEHRIKDVVYLNPADLEWPVGFNIMEVDNPNDRHLIASGLMGVFKKIWPDVWSARMEYILSNAILALLEYPGATLICINRMLSDVDYRAKVIEAVQDPVVKGFWTKEFSRYSQRYEVEATAAIQNKIGQFSANPLIRNIIGQVESTMDMRDIMDQKKIFIVNLSKGRIGEASSMLLGALVITKLYLAAMSRVDIPEEERKDFYLYVDEFQNFATESFASILSEARKYRLSLILAHQYVAQMEDMVREAVFGNAGTIVSFRVGAEDAEYLEKEYFPVFEAGDIVNLPKYNIYLKLMVEGIAGRPFSADTLLPIDPLQQPFIKEIIEESRKMYAKPKAEIDGHIAAWSQAGEVKKAKKKRKRKPKPINIQSQNSGSRPISNTSQPSTTTQSQSPNPQSKPGVKLSDAIKTAPVPFTSSKRNDSKPKEKKEIDTSGLKQALENAIEEQVEKKSGTLKPGEKISFE